MSDCDFVLETRRLILRKIRPDDYEPIAAILQNEKVMYAWEHAFTEQEVREWIEENIRRYTRDGYSYWAVVEKESGFFLGMAGILAEQVDGGKYIGLGYIFNESYWHQGYAIESASACMIYAFDVLQVDEVTAQIRPDNLNSLKVAQKLGLEVKKPFIRHYRGRDIPHLLLSRAKSKK